MSRLKLRSYPHAPNRIAVLAVTLTALCVLLGIGYDPRVAVGVVVVTTVGGVQIGCRTTAPVVAPGTRSVVLVIILVVTIALIAWGYPPIFGVAMVISVASCAAESSRRIAGQSYRLPRLAL